MKKHLLLCVGAVLLSIFVIVSTGVWVVTANSGTGNTAIEDEVKEQLTTLDDITAEFVGVMKDESKETVFCLYHSDKTERDYRFDEVGHLRAVFSTLPNDCFEKSEERPCMKENEIDDAMRDFAAKCISAYRIGEIQMVSKNQFAGTCIYEFCEVYDGIQTGSRIGLECLQDGTISYAMITKGTVFEKTEAGEIKLAAEKKITEQQAIEIAVRTVSERIKDSGYAIAEDSISCRLEATGAALYYTVEIDTFSEKEQYTVAYWAKISVADGNVLDLVFTQ